MLESDVLRKIWKTAAKSGITLFRNNVGLFAPLHQVRAAQAKMMLGNMAAALEILQNVRPIQCGLVKGSADLVGWKTITITPDMVGDTVAVFTSVEVKTDRGHATEEQNNWRDQVQAAGGYAVIAHNEDELPGL